MKNKDVALVLLITAIWGLNFSLIKLGVNQINPFLLAAMRFTLCALPAVFFLPKPYVAWRWIIFYGLCFGVGTWGLVNLGIKLGLSAGIAALILQSSAFITIGLSVIFLKERVTSSQIVGALLAFAGLSTIIMVTEGRATLMGTVIVLFAAVSLSLANVIVKRSGTTQIFSFLVWSSLFAPLPLLMLFYLSEGMASSTSFHQQLNSAVVLSIFFQVYPTTLFGYWVWNSLLRKYSVASVAPLALMVPLFALGFSALIFHDWPSTIKLVGGLLVLTGLAVGSYGTQMKRFFKVN
jgi:O-acetylserine/cysteine efflux transporter